eukprot:gene12714-12809_t
MPVRIGSKAHDMGPSFLCLAALRRTCVKLLPEPAGRPILWVLNVNQGDDYAGLANGSMVVVDVREAHEFDAGRIPGSLFNPLSVFDVGLLPTDKIVILSCRSGNRSKTAFALAQAGGRPDVDTHFAPGFLGWAAAQEEIER